MTSWRALFLAAAVGILLLTTATKRSEACNEAICASVVSKCMLTQSCKCDLVTCTCCKDCFSCLSYLYDECCSCVGKIPSRIIESCLIFQFTRYIVSLLETILIPILIIYIDSIVLNH